MNKFKTKQIIYHFITVCAVDYLSWILFFSGEKVHVLLLLLSNDFQKNTFTLISADRYIKKKNTKYKIFYATLLKHRRSLFDVKFIWKVFLRTFLLFFFFFLFDRYLCIVISILKRYTIYRRISINGFRNSRVTYFSAPSGPHSGPDSEIIRDLSRKNYFQHGSGGFAEGTYVK